MGQPFAPHHVSCMTQVFSCNDGTHVPIQCPIENSQDFFCYKQFYSINVQAVCDYKGYFMDVECMWPGSVHDGKEFANSSISHKLRWCKIKKLPDGRSCLSPVTILYKENESCTSNEQVIFNNML